MQDRPSLFIQPHYDDVPLSCGGTAAAQAVAGLRPAILTVFASEIVDAMVGDFAAWKHARWKLEHPDAVLAARRAEDAAAAQALGCTVRWLGLPDAIYRGDRYTSDRDLYGELHPEEPALAEHLAQEVQALPEWRAGNRVFVPLGAGRHVDHQLVFEAGRRLAAQGAEVFAYEDTPYGLHTPQGVHARLQELAGAVGAPVLLPIADTESHKLEAIAAYASQLPVIFRFTADWRASLSAHARALGGGVPVERFWPVHAKP